MDQVLYLAFAVAYAGLLIGGVVLTVRRGRPTASHLYLLVLLGLLYDNAVIGAGAMIGDGPLLLGLSVPRYWLHAFLTPLLVPVAWHVIVRTGARWASSTITRVVTGLVTVALVCYEVVVGAIGMHLVPQWEFGVLRYTNENAPPGPPLIVLVVAAALLVAGIVALKRDRWPWLLVGTVVMVIGSAVPIPVPSGAATNTFELILLITVLATVVHQDRRERADPRR